MIPFDTSKITYAYVYISKITKFNIEVTMDDNGLPYLPEGIDYKVRSGKTVIPIHRRVFKLYEKNNFIFEYFGKGRRSCVVFYDGYVLNIDSYKPSHNVIKTANGSKMVTSGANETEWESLNIGALNKIMELVKIDEDNQKSREIYIDGETIFFTSLDSKDYNAQNLTQDGSFRIVPVRYVRLNKMAVKINNQLLIDYIDHKENKGDKEAGKGTFAKTGEVDNPSEDKKAEQEKKKDSVIVLQEGYSLAYTPNGTDITVYSPVFQKEMLGVIKRFFGGTHTDKSGNTIHSNVYFNLNFALRAGSIIGKHYGHDETDYIDFPSIILDTGYINLKSEISIKSKKEYPLNKDPKEVFAYMFRFLYKEKDLNIYRDLVSMFLTGISINGYIDDKTFVKMYQEGKSFADVPLMKVDMSNIGKKNFDPEKDMTLEEYNTNKLSFNNQKAMRLPFAKKRMRDAKKEDFTQSTLSNVESL